MNDLQKHFDSLLHDIEFTSYDNDHDRLERIHYLIPSLSVAESQELLSRFEKYEDRIGSRKGSRKGAESFATKGFDKAVKGITGTLTSEPVMNSLKRTTGTEDQKNQMAIEDKAKSDAKDARADQVRRNNLTEEQRQAEDNQKAAEKAFNDHQNKEDVEKRTQEIFKQNGVEYPKKDRKGKGPLCDLGNISGKGSRPDNLGKISSSIVAGRKRSIHLEGEYNQESRQGSRKGSRKGEPGDTDEANMFIYLYEQDTTDNGTLRNRWNILSEVEKEYILFQFGESRQEFEETFK